MGDVWSLRLTVSKATCSASDSSNNFMDPPFRNIKLRGEAKRDKLGTKRRYTLKSPRELRNCFAVV